MFRDDRPAGRTRGLAIAALAAVLGASILVIVAAPATARSQAGARFAVANATSLSDVGTAASLVAAGAADAVLFAASANELGDETVLVVAQHAPAGAVLVGGKAALDDGIETELRRLSPDIEISRLAGSDRIDTAARAANLSASGRSGLTAVIAFGWSLPDVGTAASLVATGGGDVVLYSYGDRLGQPTADAISHMRPARVVIVGGPAAVGTDVVTDLAVVAPSAPVTRHQGDTRVETATAAAEPALSAGASHVIIANGWSARDVGIAAALAAADSDAAVLYANRRGNLADAVADVISERRPARATFVGDASRLPAELVEEIAARSANTHISRIGDLECPQTVSEAAARAAALAASPAADSSPTASGGELTVAIESCAQHYVEGAFDVRLTFSEPVRELDAGDITIVNGDVALLVGDGAQFQAVIEPATPGAVLVRLAHDAARSLDGTRSELSAPLVRINAPDLGLPAAGHDTWNRPLVIALHRAEFGRDEPDSGYTGNLSDCQPGTTSEAFRRSVIRRANWYRSAAGLDPVTENPDLSAGAQATALMMLAEGELSHYPGSDWACHSDTGAAIAAASNLGLGSAGTSGIDGYMRDAGDNNLPVGHRRWILYPALLEMGTGNAWHSRSRYRAANALDVISGTKRSGAVPIREPRDFVAWPPAGFVPASVAWGRWSFSLAGADFADAEVTVADDSGTVKAKVIAREPGAGEPGIVWAMAGDTNSRLLAAPRNGDRCYAVTIRGVLVDGEEEPPYEYPVCLIDPRAPVGPAVELSSSAPGEVGGTFEVGISFSEAVDGFSRHDIDVHNGTVTALHGSGSQYTATIRASDNGEVVVRVGSGAVHDADNRPSTAALPLTRTADVGRPEVAISSSARSTVGSSFDVTIEFSEPVIGFDAAHIRVVNGTATNLTGSGSSYRASIAPSGDGTVMVRVMQDAATDANGRANSASRPFTQQRTSSGRRAAVGLDTWDRTAVLHSYAAQFEREEPDAGFTGNVETCVPGTTSGQYREGVVQRLNWYRAAAGLHGVSENSMHTATAQHVALAYLANEQYNFSPSAACFTAEVERGANKGVATLGRMGLEAVDAFIRTDGSHNLRRNFLTPHLRQVGVGHASDPGSRYRRSFMLFTDHGDAWKAVRPQVREIRGFVAWPPAGFVAADLVPKKWSFSLADADYSQAVVTVTDHVGPVPVAIVSEDDWYREHSLVWEVDISTAELQARRPTGADHCFTVRMDGVQVGNVAQPPYEYAVCTVEANE